MKLFKMGSTPSRGSVKSIQLSSENIQEDINSRPSSNYSTRSKGSRSNSAFSRHDSRPSSHKSNSDKTAIQQTNRTGSSKSRSSQYSSPAVMYGGKSSQIQHELPGGLCDSDEPLNQSSVQVSHMLKELERLKEKLLEAEQRAGEYQEESQELQEHVLLKEDEICELSLELEDLKENGIKIQEERYQQTISAKDQYIRKLEEDLIKVKEDAAKECLHWEKKAKKSRKISATSRQDTALKLFELKDENAKLAEEKVKLTERLDRVSAGSSRCQCGTGNILPIQSEKSFEQTEDDGRTKVILDLSQQVSALDQENAKLQRELKECRKTIEKLHKNKIRNKHSTMSVTTDSEKLPSLTDFKTSTENTVVNAVR